MEVKNYFKNYFQKLFLKLFFSGAKTGENRSGGVKIFQKLFLRLKSFLFRTEAKDNNQGAAQRHLDFLHQNNKLPKISRASEMSGVSNAMQASLTSLCSLRSSQTFENTET